MNKIFTDIAWEDYLHWQTEDKKILKKINELIKDIDLNGNEGIGKPELLKHELSGLWSRRITLEHRLIYKFYDNNIYVLQCRGLMNKSILNFRNVEE
jgi:toxin YoeB